jgi:hypothetical protein
MLLVIPWRGPSNFTSEFESNDDSQVSKDREPY